MSLRKVAWFVSTARRSHSTIKLFLYIDKADLRRCSRGVHSVLGHPTFSLAMRDFRYHTCTVRCSFLMWDNWGHLEVVLSFLWSQTSIRQSEVDCVWNVMAHAQKPNFVFRRNGRVHLNRQGLQFSRLLAAEVCASAVVTLDTPSSEVVWRVLATHSIRQFPHHFPYRASPCAITFQLDSRASESPLRQPTAIGKILNVSA